MADFEKLSSFYRDKKVLVTGHTGFKGSYLTVILGMMGAKVYGYSLKPDTDPCLFDILYGAGMSSRNETELKIRLDSVRDIVSGIVESHIADIRDFDELQTFYTRVEPDIVLHLAAQPIVREGYRIPRETYEINVMCTVNMLRVRSLCQFQILFGACDSQLRSLIFEGGRSKCFHRKGRQRDRRR